MPVGAGIALTYSSDVAGRPVAAERIDTNFTGAADISDITPFTSQRPTTDPAVAAVLTDMLTYWDQELPADFHVTMTPLRGGYQSVDPSAKAFTPGASPMCIATPAQIAGNAYYCPDTDGLIFDSGGLVPVLLGHYGVAGLIGAFGHEVGHAIQVRVGPLPNGQQPDPTRYSSLILENAADCYSGAFLSWVVAGRAPHLHLPASQLVEAIAPLLDFGDPVETSLDDPVAHGLGIDRLRALLQGLRLGPRSCQRMVAGWVDPALARPGTQTSDATPRYSSENAVLAAARTSLSRFAATLPGSVHKPDPLTRWAPLVTDVQAARPFGQYAIAATEAMSLGRTLTNNDTSAACFTGAWTRSLFGTSPRHTLGSWVGDPDEALDFLRTRPAATIEQLAAFADGFSAGWPGCR